MTRDEARALWIKQLRDPEAKKEKGALESPYDSNMRCCLGHACHALGAERKVRTAAGQDTILYEGAAAILPERIAVLLDITTMGSLVEETKIGKACISALTDMNDYTDMQPSDIADWLEANWYNMESYRLTKWEDE